MIVVFGVEMNGTWFPWSGAYYGGAQWDKDQNNWKGPETFRKAFRYVVDRVRARGASNIKWMFHTNNYPYPYRNLELRACILSRIGLRRLAWPERLWTAI